MYVISYTPLPVRYPLHMYGISFDTEGDVRTALRRAPQQQRRGHRQYHQRQRLYQLRLPLQQAFPAVHTHTHLPVRYIISVPCASNRRGASESCIGNAS
jgi:hypothetical protein